MKFYQNILIKFITQILKMLPYLLTNLMLAWLLTPEKKGECVFLTYIPLILYNILNLGIPSCNVFLVSKKKNAINEIFGNTIIINVITGLTLILISFLILPHISIEKLKNIDQTLIKIIVVCVFFILLYNGLIRIFEGKKKFTTSSFYEIIYSYGWLVLLSMAFFLNIKSLNIIIYLWIISYIIPVIILLIHFFSKIGFGVSGRLMKEQVKIGIKIYISDIISTLNYKLDVIFLSLISGLYYTGIYSISIFAGEILIRPAYYISLVLLPTSASNTREQNNFFTPIIAKISFYITLILGVMAFFSVKFLLKILYSESYYDSYQSFFILIPGIIIFSLSLILSIDLIGRGKPEVNMVIFLITISVNIFFNLLLIPILNEKGAAFSTTLSHFFSTLLFVAYFKFKIKVKITDFFLFKATDIKIFTRIIKDIFYKNKSLSSTDKL